MTTIVIHRKKLFAVLLTALWAVGVGLVISAIMLRPNGGPAIGIAEEMQQAKVNVMFSLGGTAVLMGFITPSGKALVLRVKAGLLKFVKLVD